MSTAAPAHAVTIHVSEKDDPEDSERRSAAASSAPAATTRSAAVAPAPASPPPADVTAAGAVAPAPAPAAPAPQPVPYAQQIKHLEDLVPLTDPVTAGFAGFDGNVGNIAQELLVEISKRFQPYVWLYSKEQYRPCTVEYYLKNIDLFYDPVGKTNEKDYIHIKSAPEQADLVPQALYDAVNALKEKGDPRLASFNQADFFKDDGLQSNFHMTVKDDAQAGESFEEMNNVPYLVHVRRYNDYWEICYVFFYAYNGAFKICGCCASGAHSCDIEHITVRTNWNATKLTSVYYGSHGSTDGLWLTADKVEARPGDMPWSTRPVVYSADFSHGVYPSAGTWIRMCCLANDHTSEPPSDSTDVHSLWNPKADPVMLYDFRDPRFATDNKDQTWLQYPGTMGTDGISPPPRQGWWYGENTWTNNTFRRGFFVCRYIEELPGCSNNTCCATKCESQFVQPARDPAQDAIDWEAVKKYRAEHPSTTSADPAPPQRETMA